MRADANDSFVSKSLLYTGIKGDTIEQGPGSKVVKCLNEQLCMVLAVRKLMFYGRTTLKITGVLHLWLRVYYTYGYGCTTPMATGVLHLWLRVYYTYGYGCTTPMATGVLHLWLRVYYTYGYGCTTPMATGVLHLWLRVFLFDLLITNTFMLDWTLPGNTYQFFEGFLYLFAKELIGSYSS